LVSSLALALALLMLKLGVGGWLMGAVGALWMLGGWEVASVRGVPAYGCWRAVLARLFCELEFEGRFDPLRLNFPGETLRSLRGPLPL
jgi:hypothetical protein